ncbi:tetratricopeptide repeat protein [Streptomyces globisporus]|uniref:tetratricopeptide repeat protein n=1 Tax=Streptomyces globisporus TaxID=1908 RepID=UPI0037A99EDD
MTPSRRDGPAAPNTLSAPGHPKLRVGLPDLSLDRSGPPPVAAGPGAAVANEISDGVFGGAVVMAGTVIGGIHHHAAPPMQVTPRQLPRRTPFFTNRLTEWSALDAARATGTHTVVLSGIAGIGKSALAVQWLYSQQETADAQLYADLAPPHTAGSHPEAVLAPWIRALGVERPPGLGSELLGLWRSLTADREVHVLIDGARDAEQVRPLIPSGPRSLAVVTSRRLLWQLAADGALLLPVDPLAPADALTLLCAAAGAPEAAAAEERAAAAALAASCAHVPLALVVTGARLRSRPARPFGPPRPGVAPTQPQEHALSAITAALDASYSELEDDAKRLYRTLGTLPAPVVDPDLAAAVCDLPVPTAGWLLEILAEEELIGSATEGSLATQYRMSEALREHARSKAIAEHDADDQRERALRRLCDWTLDQLRHAQRLLTPAQATLLNSQPLPHSPFPDRDSALAWVDDQAENLLPVVTAAAATGWDELTYQLVDAWWPYFLLRQHYERWLAAHELGVAAARRAGNEPVVRQLLASWAIGISRSGKPAEAIPLYEEVLDAARAAGDARDEGQALLGLGGVRLDVGHPARAREHLREAIVLWESCGYVRGIGLAEITLGQACLAEEDPAAATVWLLSAYGRLTELQEHFEAGRALALLGHARTTGGDSVEGIADLERALDLVATSVLWRARALEWLGHAHRHRGAEDTARAYWLEAAGVYETMMRTADAARLKALAGSQ